MSLSRTLFNEFRPFFRLLEDPFTVGPSFSALSRQAQPFHEPFGGFAWQHRPALNLSEGEDGSYVVEAEVPGVKKENLDIKIGDGGRSLTIEGKVIQGGSTPAASAATTPTGAADASETPTTPAAEDVASTSTTVIANEGADKQVTTPKQNGWSSTKTFTRTVWLPHPINSADVKAKLEDGVLTIRAARADQKTVNVTVE